jgi:hypothetical protein
MYHINEETEEGKMLMASLVILVEMTEQYPHDVLNDIEAMKKEMFE